MQTTPIAVRFFDSDGGARPFELFNMTRVPCVGETLAHVHGVTADDRHYRVVRVLHLLERGDGGRVAEVDAVPASHTTL